jgi:hypothetical protein
VRTTAPRGACRRRVPPALAGSLDPPARPEQRPRDARAARGARGQRRSRGPATVPARTHDPQPGLFRLDNFILRDAVRELDRPPVRPGTSDRTTSYRGDAAVPRQHIGIPRQTRPRNWIDRHASAGLRLRPGATPRFGRAWLAGARDHRFPRIHSVARSRSPGWPELRWRCQAYRNWWVTTPLIFSSRTVPSKTQPPRS